MLDASTYAEAVVLNDPNRFEGLALEAVKGATLLLPPSSTRAVEIVHVPHVRVRGFRLRSKGAGENIAACVAASGACPGVILEDLDIAAPGKVHGVELRYVSVSPHEQPLVVRRCTIKVGYDAITVAGPLPADTGLEPAGGIALHDNRILGALRGIHVQGALRDTHITGNLIFNCMQECIGLEDLGPPSRRILIANNTCFKSPAPFRHWDNAPLEKLERGQVEVRNNLLFDAELADMAFLVKEGRKQPAPGDGQELVKYWRFGGNWRDLSGALRSFALPLAPEDRRLTGTELWRDPARPYLVRPNRGSPLATDGAARQDPNLPAYVGSLPPEGVQSWDWGLTWRSRAARAAAQPPKKALPP